MGSTERKKKTADAKPGPEAKPDIKPGDTDGGIVPGETGDPEDLQVAPGDGFWSEMMALVFFMTTVSCKSLADHARGKFPMETILGRRARLYSHV